MKNHIVTYKVKLDDLDFMSIVGNSNWPVILERARVEYLEEIGFPFSQMLEDKIGVVVAEYHFKFIKPAYFNDILKIDMSPHSPFSKGFTLKYSVTNQHNVECLRAEITLVFIDQKGKPAHMPEKLKNLLFHSS